MSWALNNALAIYLVIGAVIGAVVWVHEHLHHPLPRFGSAFNAGYLWPWYVLIFVLLPLRSLWLKVFPPPRLTQLELRPELLEADGRVARAAHLFHEVIQDSCSPSADRVNAVERLREAERAARAAIWSPRP